MSRQQTENRRLIYIPKAKHEEWNKLVKLAALRSKSVSEILIGLMTEWVKENEGQLPENKEE